jgi:hypothetical protein
MLTDGDGDAKYEKYLKGYESRVRSYERDMVLFEQDVAVYAERLKVWQAFDLKKKEKQLERLKAELGVS